MLTKDQMAGAGTFNNWLEGYQATRQALSDSVIALNNQLLITPPDDQSPIQHAITHQQAEIDGLDNDRILFYAGLITMSPPDPATLIKLKTYAQQADEMIANANAAEQIIKVAEQASTVYGAAVQRGPRQN